jgi:hypothetical protein
VKEETQMRDETNKTTEERSPIDRGGLGTGMMSDKSSQARDLEDGILTDDADATAGGDLRAELEKSGIRQKG